MPPVLELPKFLKYSALKSLKSCLVFSRKEEVPLHSESDIFNTIQKECHLQYLLLKITFLVYLELKTCDYGGSGTSVLVSIPLLVLAMLHCNIWVIAVA